MNREDLPVIEPQQAFRWSCPECNRENFERAEVVHIEDAEEEREAKAALGVEPWEEGQLVSCPGTVTCRQCLAMFRTFERPEEEE